MENSKFIRACFALAFGLCVSNSMAAAICNDAAAHSGEGTKVSGSKGGSVIGTIPSSDYSYTWWNGADDNSMTYYEDGSFSVEWQGNVEDDFVLGGVGMGFDSLQSYSDIGQINADFSFTKSGKANIYSYIGVYGLAASSTKEFHIVEDWFIEPYVYQFGEKKGELSVDGAIYDIYFNSVERMDKLGQGTLQQVFSVRRTTRQCGHVNVSAHFRKWEELGFVVSPLQYVWIYAESSGEKESGSVDFTYAKVSRGTGTTVVYSRTGTNSGMVESTGYRYEIWSDMDGDAMTYYEDGTFSAVWGGSRDYMARVGYRYEGNKTFQELGPLSADFEFTKSGTAFNSFFGVYGWTVYPQVEFNVVEDQLARANWDELGEKIGEITVDGDIYDVYTRYVNLLAYDTPYWVVYSVRRNFRQSGHVDISAHVEKWEELGVEFGKVYEVNLMVEALGGVGSADFTKCRVIQGNDVAASPSGSTSGDSSPTRLASMAAPIPSKGSSCVFDMQGRFLGTLELSNGVSVSEALKLSFHKAGIYLVKNGKFSQKVSVIR